MKCSKCGCKLEGVFLDYMPVKGWTCGQCSGQPREAIFCKHGDKVTFSHPDYGLECDKEQARDYLAVGAAYTVDEIHVGRSRTEIWLLEVPEVSFNSVLFERIGDAYA